MEEWGEKRAARQGVQSRVPPHHEEAERSVLGAILLQNDAIDRVREVGLHKEDFYNEAHGKIFDVACELSDKREPVDLVTLTAALRDRNAYEAVGGGETLTQLFDDAFAVGNISHYARLIKEKSVLRNLIHTCSEIIGEALTGVGDLESFLDKAETDIFKVSEHKAEAAVSPMRDILIGNMARIEELSLKKEDVTGVPTGFHEFDRLTSGLQAGQIVIIAARPGMGKTSWFISALQHAAMTENRVVALFSLEMSKEEIGFRFLSGLSRIDSKRLKVGRLRDDDWHRLSSAADQLAKSRIFIDDSGGISAMDIRARARRLLATQKRLDLIVIDYLQLMKGSKASTRGDFSREREISEISRNLKELAKELKVPIIALSQLNRSVESRQDKRPTLADLRESGAIEQDADIVCFIHRDDYYNKDSEQKGLAEFIVAKNRAGETSTVRLAWIGQYTLFANLSDEDPGMQVDYPRPEKGDITL